MIKEWLDVNTESDLRKKWFVWLSITALDLNGLLEYISAFYVVKHTRT